MSRRALLSLLLVACVGIAPALAQPASGPWARVIFGSAAGPIITSGAGSPAGVVSAPGGSLYLQSDGAAGLTLWVKTGSGTSGWSVAGGGGGGGLALADEGAALTARATLNFAGAGVTCTDNAGAARTDCTIPGGGGAAALDLITETVTASSAATVTFSAIPSTYRDLIIKVRGRGTSGAVATPSVLVQFNGDTAANYYTQEMHGADTSVAGAANSAATSIQVGLVPGSGSPASYTAALSVEIFNYRGAVLFPSTVASNGVAWGTAGFNSLVRVSWGMWRSLAPITSAVISLSDGAFVDGTVVSLYGSR